VLAVSAADAAAVPAAAMLHYCSCCHSRYQYGRCNKSNNTSSPETQTEIAHEHGNVSIRERHGMNGKETQKTGQGKRIPIMQNKQSPDIHVANKQQTDHLTRISISPCLQSLLPMLPMLPMLLVPMLPMLLRFLLLPMLPMLRFLLLPLLLPLLLLLAVVPMLQYCSWISRGVWESSPDVAKGFYYCRYNKELIRLT
jgi:hypothetical protein